MGINSVWGPKLLCKTEISKLQTSLGVDQQIVGFQISVKDPVHVQILQPQQCLENIGLDVGWGQDDPLIFDDDLQVRVHEVHHNGDVGSVTKHINKLYNVVMTDFLQEFDLSESCSVKQ